MAKDLVIVESPAKARTVGRFLGSKYVAKASMGHVRDLPRGKMGVTVNEQGFHPDYAVLSGKKKIISELTKASKEADTVYLATDPDREGEAISWHLIKAAKIDESKVRRVVFHEITRDAIREAFENPGELNQSLIDAQQARRILDRLVGYRLGSVLQDKVRRGLSAGRVQSVALRLVVDREREVLAFVPREYWTIDATLAKRPGDGRRPTPFKAGLHSIKGRKGQIEIPNEKRVKEITADLDGVLYTVASVRRREAHSRPSPPFITSTLQQEASRKLRFTARRTMQVAQQLYEGLPIGDEGSEGLITYMRTDSTLLTDSALSEANAYIKGKFGPEYAPKSYRKYKKVKGAQDAHPAISPTSIGREPESIRQYLNSKQFQLYDLIWKRMLACQMTDALFDSTTLDINAANTNSGEQYVFRAVGSILKFRGFRVLYMEDTDDPNGGEEETAPLPEVAQGDMLECLGLLPGQHFTQPPPRYSEPTLIKALEQQGIGRPSTYAPIMGTILERDYVRKELGRFVPTKLGIAVTDLLTAHFPDVMNIGFTARIEEELDEIAHGRQEWVPVLRQFYEPFDKAVERAMKEAERVPRDQILVKVGVKCPECAWDGDLVERRQRGRNGKRFYGCSTYPKCTFTVNQRPLPEPCPECGKLLVALSRTEAGCTSCKYRGGLPESEPPETAVQPPR